MSLKDALLKAGLTSSKTQNERKATPTKEKKVSEKHQEHRNHCEVCEFIQPDVERYVHKNPLVDAEWICAACADKKEIHDKFRKTDQSEFSKGGRFRREFGPTLNLRDGKNKYKAPKPKFEKKSVEEKDDQSQFVIDEDGEKNFNC